MLLTLSTDMCNISDISWWTKLNVFQITLHRIHWYLRRSVGRQLSDECLSFWVFVLKWILCWDQDVAMITMLLTSLKKHDAPYDKAMLQEKNPVVINLPFLSIIPPKTSLPILVLILPLGGSICLPLGCTHQFISVASSQLSPMVVIQGLDSWKSSHSVSFFCHIFH